MYGVMSDEEYNATHKLDRLVVWSGAFMSEREAVGYSLPKGDGYMLTLEWGDKVRVTCPAPRTEENYREVDEAINKAMVAHYAHKYPEEG